MSSQDLLLCTLDGSPHSAALVAALVSRMIDHRFAGPSWAIALELAGARGELIRQLSKSCGRRGLAVDMRSDAIIVAGRTLALAAEPPATPVRVRLREHRVELDRGGGARIGERAELLAAAPMLEALERGGGLRWALLSAIEGSDGFAPPIDVCERRPDPSLDAGLQRCFPSLVGKLGFCSSSGPQPGAVLHLTVLLGAGASVDGVRDLLAAQAQESRSRWPKLRVRAGVGSADCLADPHVHLDVDAITSAGPLLRLVAYYDPPSILAGDLLRRLAERR